MNETFLIIDGSSLIHRAFFALPSFTNKKGVNTGAVYGLCNMLLKLLEEVKPSYMAVAFDKSRHSFRTEKFADYKGQRKATPPELKEQFPLAIELLTSMGIPTLEMDNYEADDLIGTLSATAPKEMKVIIVTGDVMNSSSSRKMSMSTSLKKASPKLVITTKRPSRKNTKALAPARSSILRALWATRATISPVCLVSAPRRPSSSSRSTSPWKPFWIMPKRSRARA